VIEEDAIVAAAEAEAAGLSTGVSVAMLAVDITIRCMNSADPPFFVTGMSSLESSLVSMLFGSGC
jgi:hypothetical protein